MKKTFLVVAILAAFCSSLSFAGDLSSLLPTKEFATISYQHGFLTEHAQDGKANIMTGAFRMGGTAFWNDSHVGFGANFFMGGPYTMKLTQKDTGETISVPKDDYKGFNFGGKIGCAFDIPINNNINLLATIGPCYDSLTYALNTVLLRDMMFGIGGTVACAISPTSLFNFVIGLDVDYYFLQLGYLEEMRTTVEMSAHTSFTEVRPYVGLSIRTDKIFRSATPN